MPPAANCGFSGTHTLGGALTTGIHALILIRDENESDRCPLDSHLGSSSQAQDGLVKVLNPMSRGGRRQNHRLECLSAQERKLQEGNTEGGISKEAKEAQMLITAAAKLTFRSLKLLLAAPAASQPPATDHTGFTGGSSPRSLPLLASEGAAG